jgi:hypothetical protein
MQPLTRQRTRVIATFANSPDDVHAWDRFIDTTPNGEINQSPAWGRVRGHLGFERRILLAHRDGAIVGGAQILVRRMRGVGAIAYIPHGPVVGPDEPADVERAISAALVDRRVSPYRVLFVQPPLGGEGMAAALRDVGFRLSDADVAVQMSARLDLSVEDVTKVRGFSRDYAKMIARWPRLGVHVRVGDERDVAMFAELHARSADQHEFTALPAHLIAATYRELAADERALLMIGELNGEPVAGMLSTRCGDVVCDRISGFDRRTEVKQKRVPGAVEWASISWAKENGYRWYDIGGLSGTTAQIIREHGIEGIDRSARPFKLRFGAEPVIYPAPLELIRGPLTRRAFDLARRAGPGRVLISSARSRLRRGG